jgi:hypothetical protein
MSFDICSARNAEGRAAKSRVDACPDGPSLHPTTCVVRPPGGRQKQTSCLFVQLAGASDGETEVLGGPAPRTGQAATRL